MAKKDIIKFIKERAIDNKIKEKAIKRVNEIYRYRKYFCNVRYNTLYGAFDWEATPEGYQFWVTLYYAPQCKDLDEKPKPSPARTYMGDTARYLSDAWLSEAFERIVAQPARPEPRRQYSYQAFWNTMEIS